MTRYGVGRTAQCWPQWTGDPLAVTAPAEARTRADDPTPAERASTQARLAAWATRWLLPFVITVLLATDLVMGLVWTLSPASALTAPAYAVAKDVLSMDAHGALMIGASALATLSCFALGRAWVTGWLVGPLCGGLWLWWTVLFALAPIGRTGASYAGAVFSLALAALHLLSGLAVTHRTGTHTKLHKG